MFILSMFMVIWTMMGPVETVFDSHHLTIQVAKIGTDVTLDCFIPQSAEKSAIWIKQTIGQTGQFVGISQVSASNLYEEFQDKRFNLSKHFETFHLSIANIIPSDEGSYYCGVTSIQNAEIGNGTYLIVEDENHINRSITKVIQDPVSGPVSPGGSETLECVVLTESRTEELSVFWFRPASGASHPGLIYINKSSSGQCEGRCVYTLSKKYVDITDAGTYYCAIATSGHILFGNGTTVAVTEPVNSVLVGLVGALGCSCVVLACCLAWLICRGRAGTCRTGCLPNATDCSGVGHNPQIGSAPCKHRGCACKKRSGQNVTGSNLDGQHVTQAESGDGLSYAALSFSKKESRGRRTRREPPPDAVYAAVRL